MLPEYIFYTGVPGSRWSGIAQDIKSSGGYDCTDRADHRVYTHGEFKGMKTAERRLAFKRGELTGTRENPATNTN